ncbi:hypothetical protein ABH901_001299 [Mammaliicoccus lentus]
MKLNKVISQNVNITKAVVNLFAYRFGTQIVSAICD